MSLFSYIAQKLHDAERFFARLHRRYWLWKHRDDPVLAEEWYYNGSDEWRPRCFHAIGEYKRHDDARYHTMTLKEARSEGYGACSDCFPGPRCQPHPY